MQPVELAQLLAHQLGCPWISLAKLEIAADVVQLLPEELAFDHDLVPVHVREQNGQRVLYVATDDPTDDVALAECAAAVGMAVRPIVAIAGEVRATLARIYNAGAAGSTKQEERRSTSAFAPTERPISPRIPTPETRLPRSKAPEEFVDRALSRTAPVVLALNAPNGFLAKCRAAVATLAAQFISGSVLRAEDLVREHKPCAIVVTDDVYALDQSALNRLALDHDAQLIVWSGEVEGHRLAPLLAGAIEQWGRSSYEKGTVIDGRYELLRALGDVPNGAAGARWDVRDVRTSRHSLLALAVRSAGAENIATTRRALSRVHHPGAVELRDAGTTELGDPFVVLEPLEGRTLEGLVAAKVRLDGEDVCAVLSSVADAVAAAHAVGVAHRHIGLSNIVVVHDGYGTERAKLIGWGASVITEPEQVDPTDDVIALARCALGLLASRVPLQSGSSADAGAFETLLPRLTRAASGAAIFNSVKELATALRSAAPRKQGGSSLLDASPRSRRTAGIATSARVDQRRWVRVPYRTPVRVEIPGAGSIEGRTEDLSRGGMLIVSRLGVPVGASVTVRFALPLDGRPVAEPGVVKWSGAAASIGELQTRALGIELAAVSRETLRQINAMLR